MSVESSRCWRVSPPEPLSRRRTRVLVRVMTRSHVVGGEERPIGMLPALPRDPVERRLRRDALVEAPRVFPRAFMPRHVVAVDHEIDPPVPEKSNLSIEGEVGRRQQRGIVAGRLQRFRQAHTRNRRVHVRDRRIVRMRQLRAPDAERRLHRLRPVRVVILEPHAAGRVPELVEKRHRLSHRRTARAFDRRR